MNYLIIAILTLIITLLGYPFLIKHLHELKFGQSIREEGPSSHQKKTGTPTMGGLGFVFIPFIVLLLLDYKLIFNRQFLTLNIIFWAYGLIGFIDDYLIVVQKKNDGLKARYKLLMQLGFAVLFFVLNYSQMNTVVNFIFFSLDLGVLYIFLIIVMLVSESNAVNLTDGIDGLCASVYCVSLLPLMYIAYVKNEVVVLSFIVALFFALIAYLKFNVNPAKVFMGDTGSLALGGVLAVICIMLKVEVLLILFGGIFLIETLSVMIQVAYYKKTKKRIFLMTPIHHHFEFKGFSENKIVITFALVECIFELLGVLLWILF